MSDDLRPTGADTTTRRLERALGDTMRRALPAGLVEFVMFWLKLGWAALFGVLILGGILITSRIWQSDWPIARYDFLVAYALGLQILFLALRLESWREVKVIFLFHLTGTCMEIFKINAGSWAYPEPGLLKLLGVPLFSGFMYASVGSFMARAIRVFDMRFAPFPPFWVSVALATAIYLNFIMHHYTWDARYVLMVATVVLFARTRIWFWIGPSQYWMPLPLAAFLSAFFLWLAENIGTNTRTWLYAGQDPADWVSLSKMGSWYLLLFVSFTTVTLVFRDALNARPLSSGNRAAPKPPEKSQTPKSG